MLQELIIQSHRLELVEVAAFCGLNQLLVLNLGNNNLPSAPNLCPVKCSLESLDLEENKISAISKNYFKGFKKLRKISLGMNNIIQLPDLHWIQHTLSTITAEENHLISLEAFQTFDIFKHLSMIDVSSNNIRSFNVTLLRHMPKLATFELYWNDITHVDDFRSLYDEEIKMGQNPWHCGAALSWMGEEDMEFKDPLVCATPACLRDVAIADMSKLRQPSNMNRSMGYWKKDVTPVHFDGLVHGRRNIRAPSQYKDRLIYVWRFTC